MDKRVPLHVKLLVIIRLFGAFYHFEPPVRPGREVFAWPLRFGLNGKELARLNHDCTNEPLRGKSIHYPRVLDVDFGRN